MKHTQSWANYKPASAGLAIKAKFPMNVLSETSAVLSCPTRDISKTAGHYRRRAAGALAFAAMFFVLGPALAAVAPPLGNAQSFAVLGATPNVNNTGPTI